MCALPIQHGVGVARAPPVTSHTHTSSRLTQRRSRRAPVRGMNREADPLLVGPIYFMFGTDHEVRAADTHQQEQPGDSGRARGLQLPCLEAHLQGVTHAKLGVSKAEVRSVAFVAAGSACFEREGLAGCAGRAGVHHACCRRLMPSPPPPPPLYDPAPHPRGGDGFSESRRFLGARPQRRLTTS